MSDLLALAKEVSALINLDSISTNNPIIGVLKQLVNKCSNSFTWMIQKLENQDFALDSLPKCGKEKMVCGSHGTCKDQDGKEQCVCNPGYAGNGCQLLEADYNALKQATSQILGKIDNSIEDFGDYDEMMENVCIAYP